jgi:hypothetical protein
MEITEVGKPMNGNPTGTPKPTPPKHKPTGDVRGAHPNTGPNPNPTHKAPRPAKNPFAPPRLRVPLFPFNPALPPSRTTTDEIRLAGDFDTMI